MTALLQSAASILGTAALLLAIAATVWLFASADWPMIIDSAFPSTRLTLEDGVRLIEERG